MRKFILHFALILLFILSPISIHAQSGASLNVDPSEKTIGVGQYFSTDIIVNTGDNKIGGAGAILLYDPMLIQVDRIETGTSFDDYPLAAYDNESGRLAVSGIVGSPDKLLSGVSKLGTVIWKAVSLGETTISFDFQEGSTTDSNVAVTVGSGDALSSVSTLNVNIVSDPQPGAMTYTEMSESSSSNSEYIAESAPTGFFESVRDSFSHLFGIEEPVEIDPYAPITKSDPKTSFSSNSTASVDSSSILPLLAVVGLFIILIVSIFAFAYILKRRRNSGPAHVAMGDTGLTTPQTQTNASSQQTPPPGVPPIVPPPTPIQ